MMPRPRGSVVSAGVPMRHGCGAPKKVQCAARDSSSLIWFTPNVGRQFIHVRAPGWEEMAMISWLSGSRERKMCSRVFCLWAAWGNSVSAGC